MQAQFHLEAVSWHGQGISTMGTKSAVSGDEQAMLQKLIQVKVLTWMRIARSLWLLCSYSLPPALMFFLTEVDMAVSRF